MNHPKPSFLMRLASNSHHQQVIPAANILSARFTPEGGMSEWYAAISVQGAEALTLLQHIDFATPVTTDAKPGGILTGTLTVTYTDGDNRQKTRDFKLLGASLLQDSVYPNTYYHASERLQKCLEKP